MKKLIALLFIGLTTYAYCYPYGPQRYYRPTAIEQVQSLALSLPPRTKIIYTTGSSQSPYPMYPNYYGCYGGIFGGGAYGYGGYGGYGYGGYGCYPYGW
jgi:hypothetical protein